MCCIFFLLNSNSYQIQIRLSNPKTLGAEVNLLSGVYSITKLNLKFTSIHFSVNGFVSHKMKPEKLMIIYNNILLDVSIPFFCWDISVICPIIVLQFAVTLIYIFGHYDRTDLNYFWSFDKQFGPKKRGQSERALHLTKFNLIQKKSFVLAVF